MDLNAARELTLALMADHGLVEQGWQTEWARSGPTGFHGECVYRRQMIRLSKHHTQNESEAEVRDTVLHEITHALVGPGHRHDAVWKAKALEIGARPRASKPRRDDAAAQTPTNTLTQTSLDDIRRQVEEIPAIWVGSIVQVKERYRKNPEHHKVYRITKQNPKVWWAEDEQGNPLGWDYRVWEPTDRPFNPAPKPAGATVLDFHLGEVVLAPSLAGKGAKGYSRDQRFVVIALRQDKVNIAALGGDPTPRGDWYFKMSPRALTKTEV